ncbi:MAG: ABC transporter permease [Defluviitaleaceae bacterium]|nr:ABC transporter permease [Defluviitaleaceae bacterium]
MEIIKALWVRNIKIFLRNKPSLIFQLIMPFFFIFVFGNVFGTANLYNAISAMLAGIIAATMFDSSFRVSSSTIDDMLGGFMKEVLVSPIPRYKIAIGQFISSATIAAIQGTMILIAGFLIGFRVSTPLTLIFSFFGMIFIGLVFSGFGLAVAAKSNNMQTFQAITMALTMPMTFISGAYIPISGLPRILQWVSYFNPVTYAVNFFRIITLEQVGTPTENLIGFGLGVEFLGIQIGFLGSFLILIVFGVLFTIFSTIVFTKMDFSKINRKSGTFGMFG